MNLKCLSCKMKYNLFKEGGWLEGVEGPNQKSSLAFFWTVTHQLRNTAVLIWNNGDNKTIVYWKSNWAAQCLSMQPVCMSVCVSSYCCPLFEVVASGAGGGRVRKVKKKSKTGQHLFFKVKLLIEHLARSLSHRLDVFVWKCFCFFVFFPCLNDKFHFHSPGWTGLPHF